MREVEVKAVVPDVDALRARLSSAAASCIFEGSLHDRRYDTAARVLVAADRVLRLRVQAQARGNRATLEFKEAVSVEDGYKVREESGSAVDDPEVIHRILTALGYVVTREVDREITVYVVAGATVRLERYPRMDVLVEVEGEPTQIERAIAVLGLPRDSFNADALVAFVRRFEQRTGLRAAICGRELEGDFRYKLEDA